jgi:hypothetical protein
MLKITNNAVFFPKGHLTDRYGAIDAIDLNTNLSYQIKAAKVLLPATSAELLPMRTIEKSLPVLGRKC